MKPRPPGVRSYYVRFCWLLVLCSLPVLAQEKANEKQEGKSPPEALNQISDAASFQNNGAFESAVDEWEKFLKQFPNDPFVTKARHHAGVCHLQLKHFDQAAAHFQTILAKDEKFELAEDASINLGWCQFSLGRQGKQEMYGKAIETLTAHLGKFAKGKSVDQALFYLGEANYALGRKPEAIAAYQRLVNEQEKSSLRADAMYALGVMREESQQYPEAGSIYDAFVQEFPNSVLVSEVRMRKGETLFHTGQLAAAEAIFSEVAAKPDFASADHAVFRQADCAAKQDKFVYAGQLYARVATSFPNSTYLADASIAAGRCFYRADKLADAATWLRKTIELGGKDVAEAAHWLCRVHLKQKEPHEVVELANSLMAKAGDSPYLVNLKMDQADALNELANRKVESIDRYLKITLEHPRHELAPQALYNAAFTALELKRFDDGSKHAAAFEQKFSKDRLLPDAKYVAAECQLHLGKYTEAEAAYQSLIDQHAKHAEANLWRVRLGLAIYLQKKYATAAKTLGGFLPQLTNPDQLAESQFLIGVCKFEQNQPAEAAQLLAESLTTQAKWRQADETLLFLSRAQKSLGKIGEARDAVQQLIADFPDSKLLDQAHYRLGEYLDAAGDYPAAVAAYDVVLTKYESSPLAPYSAYGKGWAKMRAKDFAGASESFSDLLAKYDKHALAVDTYFARGMSRRQAGQFSEAIADIVKFLQSNPDQPRKSDALYERGLAEAALKQYAEAAKTFAAIIAENKSYAHAANVIYELAWASKHAGQNAEATTAFARLAADYADSTLASEALYHVGEDQYQQKQFAEAIKSYTAALSKAQGEVAENVMHKLSWSHFRLGQYEPALTQFREQTEKFPSGPLAADALFMRAECLFKLQNHNEAWPAFESSIKSPTTLRQMQPLAYLHGGQAAAQLEQWQASLKLLDVIPEKFPDSIYVAEALYERGWAKQNLKKLDDALVDYERAAAKSRGEVGARARYMIGKIQFERKEHAAAVTSFLRVMYGYGGDSASEAVKSWQGAAGYEAGRCVEVQIQNTRDPQQKAKLIQDARTYYTFVAEKHAMHKLADEAKVRRAALLKLR